ncbi:MAG: hypothetical protein RR639_04270 [Hydrogenoanaerobacterium sp.]
MGRPPKPVIILENEQKSHRTKAELDTRRKAEKSLESGVSLREWKSTKENDIAHKEFLRLSKLLANLKKNDALYQNVINRYAQLMAECNDFEKRRESLYASAEKLEARYYDGEACELNDSEFYKLLTKMQEQVIACDKQVQAKRKMMFDIEKENIMTIASALRSIPKKPEEEAEDDPMAALLGRRA